MCVENTEIEKEVGNEQMQSYIKYYIEYNSSALSDLSILKMRSKYFYNVLKSKMPTVTFLLSLTIWGHKI